LARANAPIRRILRFTILINGLIWIGAGDGWQQVAANGHFLATGLATSWPPQGHELAADGRAWAAFGRWMGNKWLQRTARLSRDGAARARGRTRSADGGRRVATGSSR
jgi:hypothetical protein